MTKLLDAATYKQLFLDDHAIESTQGVVRRLHQPERQGPVLKPDRSRDQTLVQSASVPQWNPEKDLWEWWYLGFYDAAPYQGPGAPVWGDIHYATSADGVEWERPSLGLYEWRGSRDNNLAYHSKVDFLRRRGMRNPVDIGERRLHHIFRDERDPDPSRRYKAFFANGDNVDRYPGLSPDGFHWTFPHVDGIRSDDTSQLIYDDYNDRFVATVKQRTEWGRSVWLTLSDDFVEWSEPVLVLHTDETDQANRRERIRRVVEDPAYLSPPHVDEETDFIAQLYKMPFMPYEGQYVGFPLLFNPAGLDVPQMNHVGLNQTELAVSRDLLHWERVADREIFLGVEPWDGVNYGTCQVAVCGRPIVRDNEIWVYFMAVRFRGVPESYPPEYAEYFKDMGAWSWPSSGSTASCRWTPTARAPSSPGRWRLAANGSTSTPRRLAAYARPSSTPRRWSRCRATGPRSAPPSTETGCRRRSRGPAARSTPSGPCASASSSRTPNCTPSGSPSSGLLRRNCSESLGRMTLQAPGCPLAETFA